MTIGDRIKYYREQAGLTQDELARKTGVSPQAISKYENGIVTNIPTKRLQLIADAVGTNGAILMGYDNTISEANQALANWALSVPPEQAEALLKAFGIRP